MHGKAFNMMALAREGVRGRSRNSMNPLNNLDRMEISVVKMLEKLPSSRSRSLSESIIDEKSQEEFYVPKRRSVKVKMPTNPLGKNLDDRFLNPEKQKTVVFCHIEKMLFARWKILIAIFIIRIFVATSIVVFDNYLYPGDDWKVVMTGACFAALVVLLAIRLLLVKYLQRGVKIVFVFYLALTTFCVAFYEYAISQLTSQHIQE